MRYTSRIPSPPLDAFVDGLYYLESAAPFSGSTILLMPSLHLMFNLGPPLRVRDPSRAGAEEACARSWWLGLWSGYRRVDAPRGVRIVGAHFKPFGASAFLRLPLVELYDRVVPAGAIWGAAPDEIHERLFAAPTIDAALALLERWLLARLGGAPRELGVVRRAVGEIARHRGALPIRALSERIGLSQNHLARQFRRLVGVSPKALARFHRFAHVLEAVEARRPTDWTRLAHEAGFYDQSHFNKDFAAFTGLSPTEYLRAPGPRHIEPLRAG